MVSAHNSKRLPNKQSQILGCCNSLNHLVDTVRNNWNSIQDYIMGWYGSWRIELLPQSKALYLYT